MLGVLDVPRGKGVDVFALGSAVWVGIEGAVERVTGVEFCRLVCLEWSQYFVKAMGGQRYCDIRFCFGLLFRRGDEFDFRLLGISKRLLVMEFVAHIISFVALF